MKLYRLYSCVCILLLGVNPLAEGAAVDVALNKEILADALDVTCGVNGAEEYYTASELYKAPGDRQIQVFSPSSINCCLKPSYASDIKVKKRIVKLRETLKYFHFCLKAL